MSAFFEKMINFAASFLWRDAVTTNIQTHNYGSNKDTER